jgi:hypothetical protein
MKSKFCILMLCTIVATGITMSSCKKEEPLKGIAVYSVARPNDLSSQINGTVKFTDVFNVSVTYRDASGAPVTVNGVALPWELEQVVEAPFTASIDVNITLRQLTDPPYEFPRPNGDLTRITIESGGKLLSEGTPAPGTGSGLYSKVNDWLATNGHVSHSLIFTAETLDKDGSSI